MPPAQANYLQRVGRAGRKDGNSLAVTLANGQPGAWARDVQARVFTLELTLDSEQSEGLVCEWKKDQEHHNYGISVFPEGGPMFQAKAFLQAIGRII